MAYPERNELVVCKIEKIMPYGASVILEEYQDVKGFVPLSQIAARWVKNIRNFIKVDQIKVGKVVYINFEKGQVDLSFAKVSDMQENQKLNEWRQTKRVNQLIGLVAKDMNRNPDSVWDSIVNPILEKYNSVYDAFKDIAIYGKDHVLSIPEDYREPLYNIVSKNIVIHEKEISEQIKLLTKDPKGILRIKSYFDNMPKDKSISVNLSYIGNGKYLIKAKAIDYKKIEKSLDKINEYLTKEGKKFDEFELKRL